MTLGELVEKLGGRLVQGDPEMPIIAVRSPEEANPWDLVFAEDAVSAAKAFAGGASAVVFKPGCAAPSSCGPRHGSRRGRSAAALVCPGGQTPGASAYADWRAPYRSNWPACRNSGKTSASVLAQW